MSDLDSLLGKIEDDVSTKDPWETNSYRSTIAGFGTLTGKLLMNVGIGLLSGVSYVGIRTALARIARTHARYVRDDYWPGFELDEKAYRDILEYQRPGLYSREVNIVAWHLLLEEICREHDHMLVDAAFTPGFVRVDVQILVNQLIACYLTDWSRYPREGDHDQLDPPQRPDSMHMYYCRFLAQIAERDRTLLRDIYKPEDLVALMRQPTIIMPHSSNLPQWLDDRADVIIQTLEGLVIDDEQNRNGYSNKHTASLCILDTFVSLLEPGFEVQVVVDYLISAIRSHWVPPKRPSSEVVVLTDVALLLCIRSPEASKAFLKSGVLEVFDKSARTSSEAEAPSLHDFDRHESFLLQANIHTLVLAVHNPVDAVMERVLPPYALGLIHWLIDSWLRNGRHPMDGLFWDLLFHKELFSNNRFLYWMRGFMKKMQSWRLIQQTANRLVEPIITKATGTAVLFRYCANNLYSEWARSPKSIAPTCSMMLILVLCQAQLDVVVAEFSDINWNMFHVSLEHCVKLLDKRWRMEYFTERLSQVDFPPHRPIRNPVDVFARLYAELGLEHFHRTIGDNPKAQLQRFTSALNKGSYDILGLTLSDVERDYRADTVKRLRRLPKEARKV